MQPGWLHNVTRHCSDAPTSRLEGTAIVVGNEELDDSSVLDSFVPEGCHRAPRICNADTICEGLKK